MKNGLFSKMIAAFTIIISLSFVVTSAILSFWFQNYYLTQRRNQIVSQSQFVRTVALQYFAGNISQERTNDTLEELSGYLSADIKADMFIMDMYGYIHATSNPQYDKLIGKQIVSKDIKDIKSGKMVENTNVYNGIFDKAVHTYEIPITYNGTFEGIIMINTSVTDIKHPLRRVYIIIWISAILAIIAACFVIYYFSQKIIIKPLGEINSVARKIAKGEVDKRVGIESDDEIGELAESFNFMADSLEKVENNRREFISNVSHEIRSPITSIKGFIGGILDGIIPQDREKYYLSLTYDEINRLTRLVNDLLDLSSMEAGHLKLNIVKLNINEMIKNTVIKFETKINEKKLKVDVCFNSDALYVLGDEDRINQVLTNLIDNAIKYVNDDGKVVITTRGKSNKAYISIYNNGPQINEEDFKHIWNRFYKSDKSRTTKMSTGLGLPIVRSILTQHGEDIHVENKKEGGVEFTFSLKLVT
ncbi:MULTISPECIES: sensor histidine kinase [Clostridium]|uniref:sensor histidine kinase n=1 Tax=Clostridium TaxID=1485 RepID=UPI00069E2965|nr:MULTISPECIES: HAMP domain-containing sensor histidine kinase [Clostridium]KOF56199.1 histidine kinase [Clostridium sp. DMHC 10]MCD2347865.1 HAMP domain-containing histidine kinase [Clostridium guangxiense]